jgi:hypothetical protein
MTRTRAMITALVLLLLAAACGNPRRDAPVTPPVTSAEAAAAQTPARPQPVSIVPAREAGERYRTVRRLRVEEALDDGGSLTMESEEVTLTHVQRVDESGRLLAIRRDYESVVTRVASAGGEVNEARGELDGCSLELTQRVGGVQARVIAGDARVGQQQFVLEGFDTALLPRDPVTRGTQWTLEGASLQGLNRLIESMDFSLDRNRMQCVVTRVEPEFVEIALDWRITGEYHGRAAVMRYTGELRFDRESKLITSFSLSGGRQATEGPTRQVRINITRQPTQGWLDMQR